MNQTFSTPHKPLKNTTNIYNNEWVNKTLGTGRKDTHCSTRHKLVVLGILILLTLGVGKTLSPETDDAWAPKAAMSVPREDLAVVTVNGKIYAIGGYNGTHTLATVEEYDPITDSWQARSSMSIPRGWLAATVVDNKIYAIGGWDGTDYLTTVEEYNPITDTWRNLTDMPTPRYGLGVVSVGGRIYAIGGAEKGIQYAIVEEYNPTTDSWTTKADMPTPRYGLAAVMLRGRIYAIGGHNTTSGYLSTLEEYDPILNSWTIRASMPTARVSLAAVTMGGRIYAIGGWGEQTPSVVEEYSPLSNEWQIRTPLPTARTGLAATELNGYIYVIGGYDGVQRLGTVELYDPPYYDTDQDEIADDEELRNGRNPIVPETDIDTDEDGLLDQEEVSTYETDPWISDIDLDIDGDGLTNVEEVDTYKTNITMIDTDNDSFSDGLEVDNGTNPLDPDDYPVISTSTPVNASQAITTITVAKTPRPEVRSLQDLFDLPFEVSPAAAQFAMIVTIIVTLVSIIAAIKAMAIPPPRLGKRSIKDFLKRFFWYLLYPFTWVFSHVIYDPIIRRLTEEDVTANKARQTILQLLEERGVAHVREIERAVGSGFFGIMWHLQVLDDFGHIRHVRVGKYLVYYLKGDRDLNPPFLELAILFKNQIARAIIIYIKKHPGTYQAEIARALGLHHDSVRYHLLQMNERDLLDSHTEGRTTRYFLRDEKTELIDSILTKVQPEPT